MDDLRRRFASLDRVPAPDLWDTIERRAAAPEHVARVTAVVTRVPMRSRRSSDRSLVLILAAAAILVALVAGAVTVGSGLVKRLAIVPALVVSPSPAASPTLATPLPSISPAPSAFASDARVPWIVFRVGGVSSDPADTVDPRLWAMRADGSGAHGIADGGPVAWSRDGTRLLMLKRAFPDDGSILVAEVGEDIGTFVDRGVQEPSAEQWEAFDFAPDNERVVFVRKYKCAAGASPTGSASSAVVLAVFTAETAGANCYVLSVLDLRTGERTDLDGTLVKDQTANKQPGSLELPAWSPDGTKIAYTRLDESLNKRELWVVNANGTNASRVELAADISVQEPRWSPDGTRISFTSETQLPADVVESAVYVADLGTGRLDRITIESDPAARQLRGAEWLDNNRLRVEGGAWTDENRFWLVALDAIPHEAQVLVDLTESLTAIPGSVSSVTAPGEPGRSFFWQPVHSLTSTPFPPRT